MRTAHELLTAELRPWTDDAAAVFIRNCVLPRCHGHKPAARIAADAAPRSEPSMMPVIEMGTFITLQPSKRAMAEADLIGSFFEGVPHATGEARRLAYLQRKLERSLNRD